MIARLRSLAASVALGVLMVLAARANDRAAAGRDVRVDDGLLAPGAQRQVAT